MSEGRAGDNVGILLRGIRRDEVERGQVRARLAPRSACSYTCVTPGSPVRRTSACFLSRVTTSKLLPDMHGQQLCKI